MADIISIETGTVQEVMDALQKVQNKNAVLLHDPVHDGDPFPFRSLYVDGDFIMLSTEEYRKEQSHGNQ